MDCENGNNDDVWSPPYLATDDAVSIAEGCSDSRGRYVSSIAVVSGEKVSMPAIVCCCVTASCPVICVDEDSDSAVPKLAWTIALPG